MSALVKAQIVCIVLTLIGFVWLTVAVFGTQEESSLYASAALTWAGLIANAACALLRLKKK